MVVVVCGGCCMWWLLCVVFPVCACSRCALTVMYVCVVFDLHCVVVEAVCVCVCMRVCVCVHVCLLAIATGNRRSRG